MRQTAAPGQSSMSHADEWRSEVRRFAAEPRPDDGGGVYLEIVIPTWAGLTREEQTSVNAGGSWPIRQRRVHLDAGHCRLIEFLVGQCIGTWGSKCE